MNMNVVRNNSSKRINIINMHAYDKLVALGRTLVWPTVAVP